VTPNEVVGNVRKQFMLFWLSIKYTIILGFY
jgi:hypothetical protein